MSKISLLPPEPRYAELFVSWLLDPIVVKYSEQRHKIHTVQSQLDYWKSPATVAPSAVWIIHLDTGPIGSISATVDEMNEVADIGILIGDRNQWLKGYGFSAWSTVCDVLLATKVRKIEGGCMSLNYGMRSIMEKYGMQLEGRRREHFRIGNHLDDCVFYGKLKP